MFVFSGFGITGGAHRYWAHRAFKASTPLRVFMLLGFASAGQVIPEILFTCMILKESGIDVIV